MAVPEITEIDPRYVEAARLRILEGKTWGEVAEALGVIEKTVYLWRQSVEWQAAVLATLSIHAGQYSEVALGRLAASAKGEPGSPGVTAANSLLDRIVGTVQQRLGLGQDPNAEPTRFRVVYTDGNGDGTEH